MSDERQDEELDTRIGKASAVMRACNTRLSRTENCHKMQSSQFSKQFLSPFLLTVMNLGE